MVVNNPNNWHWVDKNCIDWAREYFKDKLIGLTVGDEPAIVKITTVKSLEGDVEVCQRKGKVISLFDLKLTITFENGDVKGNLIVPEIAYDSDEDDYQFEISFTTTADPAQNEKARLTIRNTLVPKLRSILGQFGVDLIKVHGSDIQMDQSTNQSKLTLENQTATSNKDKVTEKTVLNKSNSATPAASSTTSNTSSSVPKYNTSTLHLTPVFNAPASQLYMTLLQPERVQAWTRSEAKIQPVENTDYFLFNGNITGKITKLIPDEKIVMTWRLNDWKAGHYAKLTIDLVQGYSETKMDVLFEGIPIGEEDNVESNFEDYYVKPIKITFGFGAVLN